jgi:hypothetical protein
MIPEQRTFNSPQFLAILSRKLLFSYSDVLFSVLVLFFVFLVVPLFGQNYSDNISDLPPQPRAMEQRRYSNSDKISNTENFEHNHDILTNTKSYPLKRKIPLDKANAVGQQNSFTKQQEELIVNKRNAIKKIPFDDLSPLVRRRLSAVIQNHTVYYQLPTQAIFCDPEVYQYFLEHPDLLVGLWETLGISQLTLRETDVDRYNLLESSGTAAEVGLLYRSTSCCIVYAKGEYKNPITNRKIEGETLLILHSRYARNIENEPIIVCKLDVFIKIDNIGADILVKLFSTTLGKIADGNFEQTLGFVSHVSDTSAISAKAVKKLTKSVKNVREEVRNDFEDVVDRVSLRAARRVEKRLYNYNRGNNFSEDNNSGQTKISSGQTKLPSGQFGTNPNQPDTPQKQPETTSPQQNQYENNQNRYENNHSQYERRNKIESVLLRNEFLDPKLEINFGNIQDLTPSSIPSGSSPNKKAVFSKPKF